MEKSQLKDYRLWTDDQMRELLHRTLRESEELSDRITEFDKNVYLLSRGLDELQNAQLGDDGQVIEAAHEPRKPV
jgi:hypothetical protein